MIAEVDCNGDGIIDFCEFLKMMSRHSNPGVDPEQQLAEVFRLFDKDRSGYITQVSETPKKVKGGKELSQWPNLLYCQFRLYFFIMTSLPLGRAEECNVVVRTALV